MVVVGDEGECEESRRVETLRVTARLRRPAAAPPIPFTALKRAPREANTIAALYKYAFPFLFGAADRRAILCPRPKFRARLFVVGTSPDKINLAVPIKFLSHFYFPGPANGNHDERRPTSSAAASTTSADTSRHERIEACCRCYCSTAATASSASSTSASSSSISSRTRNRHKTCCQILSS